MPLQRAYGAHIEAQETACELVLAGHEADDSGAGDVFIGVIADPYI